MGRFKLLKPNSTFVGRIFWSIIPTFVAIFALVGLISIRQHARMLEREFNKRGATLAANLARGSELGVMAGSNQLLAPSIRGATNDSDVGYVVIYDADKQLLVSDGQRIDSLPGEAMPLSPDEFQNLRATREPVVLPDANTRARFVEFIAPIVSQQEQSPDELLIPGIRSQSSTPSGGSGSTRIIGYVRLGLSLQPLDQQRAALINLWIMIGLAALVASAIAIYLVSRHITAPIHVLTRGAELLATGRLNQQIPVSTRDEIGRLAETFNEMAGSLSKSMRSKELLLDEVRDLNRDLESRVKQRTLELQDRTEMLEVANRHKSEFLANMSHELRTPLNAIIGYSEMLEEEAAEEELENFVEDLKKIHSSGRHLLSLINDVLDLSKIEAGRMEMYIEAFDVRELIDDVASTVKPLAAKNSNTFEVECENAGQIRADVTRLRQCLFNLLSNACKFTDQGTIRLSVERSTVDGKEWIAFRVSDTGIGMTEEQADLVFDAFKQAESSTTRKFGGTGLGLTISREFCRMMGGTIEVESKLDVGSTFTIKLPTDTGATVDRERIVVSESAQGVDATGDDDEDSQIGESSGIMRVTDPAAPRVLVIDDDANARDLMFRYLTRDGFNVSTAASGREGLEMARADPPDVITLDVMMPGMDGWAVLRELKADPDMHDVPVIMVSIVNDQSMGHMLGVADYIMKPVNHHSLSKVLGRYRCPVPPCAVLVIEDDAVSRGLMCTLLEKQGWEVDQAENGLVGLERVAARRPQLIILDLMMPEMDGFEFLHELRKNKDWRSIPVAVCTAKQLTEADQRELDGRVQSVFQKGGFTRDDLVNALTDLITRCGANAISDSRADTSGKEGERPS
ncbi:MAG: response regulator [Phycisphaera sp.]|nr:response regulator [Phycisphaera sp.]